MRSNNYSSNSCATKRSHFSSSLAQLFDVSKYVYKDSNELRVGRILKNIIV